MKHLLFLVQVAILAPSLAAAGDELFDSRSNGLQQPLLPDAGPSVATTTWDSWLPARFRTGPSEPSKPSEELEYFGEEYMDDLTVLENNPREYMFRAVFNSWASRPTMDKLEEVSAPRNTIQRFFKEQYALFQQYGLPPGYGILPDSDTTTIRKLLALFDYTEVDNGYYLHIRHKQAQMAIRIETWRPTNIAQFRDVFEQLFNKVVDNPQRLGKFPSDILGNYFVKMTEIIWKSGHFPILHKIDRAKFLQISLNASTAATFGDKYQKRRGENLQLVMAIFGHKAGFESNWIDTQTFEDAVKPWDMWNWSGW